MKPIFFLYFEIHFIEKKDAKITYGFCDNSYDDEKVFEQKNLVRIQEFAKNVPMLEKLLELKGKTQDQVSDFLREQLVDFKDGEYTGGHTKNYTSISFKI